MLSDKRKPVKVAVLSCATLSKSLHRMIAIANAIEGIRNRILKNDFSVLLIYGMPAKEQRFIAAI